MKTSLVCNYIKCLQKFILHRWSMGKMRCILLFMFPSQRAFHFTQRTASSVNKKTHAAWNVSVHFGLQGIYFSCNNASDQRDQLEARVTGSHIQLS